MKPEFDRNQSYYKNLDDEARIAVHECTAKIKKLVRRSAQDTIDIGKNLLKVKKSLDHGDFENWLKAEFCWGLWMARKFMNVAERFSSVNFTDLSIVPSVLYILAAPSTPEKARIEALERASQGERITCSDAKKLVEQHKSAAQLESSKEGSILVSEVTEVTPAHPDNSPVSSLEQLKPEFAVESDDTSDNQSSTVANYINKHPSEEEVELEAAKKEEHSKQEHFERDKTLVSEDKKIRNQSQFGVEINKVRCESINLEVKRIEWKGSKPIKKVIQAFVITSPSVRIDFEADPEALTTLLKQMQLHPNFAKEFFQKAKSLAESEFLD